MAEQKKKNPNIIDTQEKQQIKSAYLEQKNLPEKIKQKKAEQIKKAAAAHLQNKDYRDVLASSKQLLDLGDEEGSKTLSKKGMEGLKLLKSNAQQITSRLPKLGIITGLASALAEQKAEAAVPVLGDVEELGKSSDPNEEMIENPSKLSTKDREKLKERLQARMSSRKE